MPWDNLAAEVEELFSEELSPYERQCLAVEVDRRTAQEAEQDRIARNQYMRLYNRSYRQNMSPEQLSRKNELNREYMREKRKCMTETERVDRNRKQREWQARKLARMSKAELQEYREKMRERYKRNYLKRKNKS